MSLFLKMLYSMTCRISFEAGGNSPFIVFDDADIDAAVEGKVYKDRLCHIHTHRTSGAVTSKFRGSGQTCICANRIYVQSSVYADFASKLTAKVEKLKVGNGFEQDTFVISL